MKKLFITLTGVLFSLSVLSVSAFAEKPGADHSIKGAADKKPAVHFNHTAHEERAGGADHCKDCHHKDEAGHESACTGTAECHGKGAKAKQVKKLHKRCKDACHKKDKKGPTKCAECHKK